jgi:nucleotide-binding universal stress UspA family protein
VERALPAGVDSIEDEYQGYVTSQATASLERVVDQVRGDLDISVTAHQSTSIPRGLIELVDQHSADLVVVGSSSSGLLGRVALGSVTERLVHTAEVPVAIAPRGYPFNPVAIQRLTAAYGGSADATGLIQTAAELAQQWSVRLRIASFTVRPSTLFGGSIERSAEDLVVRRWTRKTMDAALSQLSDARATIAIPDVDVVVGAGTEWDEAVNNIAWQSGDMLLLGSGAAGAKAQVFLGSAAAKILRHTPVPVMIVPRHRTPQS